jgi:multiple sugar transport system substrate-binding protein
MNLRSLSVTWLSLNVVAVVVTACTTASPPGLEHVEDVIEAEPTEQAIPTPDEGSRDALDEPTTEPIEVQWFVGVGFSSTPAQEERVQALVDGYNQRQEAVELVVTFAAIGEADARLAERVAEGNAPDIVGPMGRSSAYAIGSDFLALDEFIAAESFDQQMFGDSLLASLRDAEGSLRGLPFSVYPSAVFVNTELFDAAGLPYPPTEYAPDGTAIYGPGTPYEGLWDFAKLVEIGSLLTLDSVGRTAVDVNFDKDDTVQWGYSNQWTEEPGILDASIGAAELERVSDSAAVPPSWGEALRWYQQAIHTIGFVPNEVEELAPPLAGNAFASGRVAMVNTQLWYVCCIHEGTFWDLAIVPTRDGISRSPVRVESLHIHAETANPEAAFQVLIELETTLAADLADIYTAMPARIDLQDGYLAQLDSRYPQTVNWDVMSAVLEYAVVGSWATDTETFAAETARINQLRALVKNDPDVIIDEAILELEADLGVLWQAAK